MQNWALNCLLVSMTTSHFYLLAVIAETLLLHQSTLLLGLRPLAGDLQEAQDHRVRSEYTSDE